MRAISLRTAVTTSPDRAPAMAKELERVGLHPVVLPCLEVHPAGPGTLERARRAAEEADLLVLTSARVLGLLWPDGGFPATPVAAVGRSTAEGVRARGGRVLAVGDGGLRSLLDEFDPKGRTVAYPHAEGTDAVGLRLLEQGARRLVAVAVYRSVPRGPGTDPVEAAAFASPSAVEGWCMTRSLADIRVGAIGPTTAAALEQRGRRADVVASSSSYRMLAEGLAALGVG